MNEDTRLVHFLLEGFEFETQLSNCSVFEVAKIRRNSEVHLNNRWERIRILVFERKCPTSGAHCIPEVRWSARRSLLYAN